MSRGIVATNKARCRDCYRCVRVCPVKAIRISDGQAHVDASRCVVCGTCVRECPQKAKQVRNDLDKVRLMIEDSNKVIASVAPSYVAAFPDYGGVLFPAMLKALGFAMVTETAVGAEMVARETALLVSEEPYTHISSACPALVDFISKYHPSVVGNITPIVSPMVAHARYLKARYGKGYKVVFIGPCPAKKAEAEDPHVGGAVDAVLTYEELRLWIDGVSIRKDQLISADFDDIPASLARLFPLEGGLAESASMGPNLLRQDFAAISGSSEVVEMLENIKSGSPIRLFEALFCPGGCINGACFGDGRDIFRRRNYVLQHQKRAQNRGSDEEIRAAMECIEMRRAISENPIKLPKVSEEAVREVLARTGKTKPEDELNCGACGYASCRDNAIAVLIGMAEQNMCLPWMRKVAERKADQIIDNSPNGIVIVDSTLRVVDFNPAFGEMFSATQGLIGKPLSTIMDPDDFEKVLAGTVDRIVSKEVSFPSYHVSASMNVYRLEDEDLVVGIFSNISRGTEGLSRLDRIREETLSHAEEVIKKQMTMAQEIAGILGETTSETRVLLRKLTDLIKESEDQNERPKDLED